MAGLADAFRMRQQPMELMRDPLMPRPLMPQMHRTPFDLGPLMQQPLLREEQAVAPPSRLNPSPDFAEFLRNYYLPRQGL